MRWWKQATTFLLAGVSSASPITRSSHSTSSAKDITTVAGSTGPNHVSIQFASPCLGCFAGSQRDVEINLEIDNEGGECSASNIYLNGFGLVPNGRTDHNNGNIIFYSRNAASASEDEVLASWNLTCNERMSLLSVKFNNAINKGDSTCFAGFAMEFHQLGRPVISHLHSRPIPDALSSEVLDRWFGADIPPRLVIVPPSLAGELRELEDIKTQLNRLRHLYHRQEYKIAKIITHEFEDCNSISCMIQTAMKKAPDAVTLLKTHFRPHPKHPPFSRIWPAEIALDTSRPDVGADTSYLEDTPIDNPDEMPLTSRPPPPPSDHDHHLHGSPDLDGVPQKPPFGKSSPEDLPELDGHPYGPPPPPPPPPPSHGRPPHGHPLPPGHHSNNHFGRPFRGHHHHRHRPWFFSIGALFFVLLFTVVACKLVKKRIDNNRIQRRRQRRAARREECRARVAYRCAAAKYRWSRWWSKFHQPEATYDYDEKRQRILEQENQIENVMQNEISDLRRAHEIVGDMMRAEQDRQRMYHELNFGSGSRQGSTNSITPDDESSHVENTRLNDGNSSDDGHSIQNYALPPYQLPPPSYEAELEGEMMVVDGFRYTPSNTDDTPDSSVVDCESHLSFNTGGSSRSGSGGSLKDF